MNTGSNIDLHDVVEHHQCTLPHKEGFFKIIPDRKWDIFRDDHHQNIPLQQARVGDLTRFFTYLEDEEVGLKYNRTQLAEFIRFVLKEWKTAEKFHYESHTPKGLSTVVNVTKGLRDKAVITKPSSSGRVTIAAIEGEWTSEDLQEALQLWKKR